MQERYRFIDLFAGIGGFRLALEQLGHRCVYSAEINPHACQMYQENFGDNPYCDITQLDTNNIPNFDILCAGFPCQSFSISGKQKGFYDTRGTLFFDVCRIIEAKKPSIVVLENVANLEKHDNGRTLNVMLDALIELGYSVSYKIFNAIDFGLPQNRERIFIIATIGKQFDFSKVKKHNQVLALKDFLEEHYETLPADSYTLIENPKKQKSGLIFAGYRNKKIRVAGVREGTEHLSRVHKQSIRIYSSEGVSPTIASQEKSGRYWIYHQGQVRKLTIDECYSLFGFPKSYKKTGALSLLYERIGNSVCVPVVEAVVKEVINQMASNDDENKFTSSLEQYYQEALTLLDKWRSAINNLSTEEKDFVNILVDNEETSKAVYTVVITSLLKKIINPEQDVRLHKVEFLGGYSGRSLDTAFVTPFLKAKNFRGAMKESGWLTRSLEQAYIYDLNYKGKIQNQKVKQAFLQILDAVEKQSEKASNFLLALFCESLVQKKQQSSINLISPIKSEAQLTITEILSVLEKHFKHPYKKRGRSILPIIAIYSVYECIINELSRFQDCQLKPLASHYSSDRSSKEIGDIVILKNEEVFESLEIKSEITITNEIIADAYKKIQSSPVQRYYILSTICDKSLILALQPLLQKIREEHGCQVIVNGVFDTLKYYLRLLQNTDIFIERYLDNLVKHPEISAEFKIAWNQINKNNVQSYPIKQVVK